LFTDLNRSETNERGSSVERVRRNASTATVLQVILSPVDHIKVFAASEEEALLVLPALPS